MWLANGQEHPLPEAVAHVDPPTLVMTALHGQLCLFFRNIIDFFNISI
jgi:hypothetical protein